MDMMQTLSQELSVPRGQIESAVSREKRFKNCGKLSKIKE